MSMSGVKLDPVCIEEFNKMKLKHAYRYIIFKLSDDHKSIVIDQLGPKDATFDTFLAYMKQVSDKKDCRYAAYDVEFEAHGGMREKLLFILWAPDTSAPKLKMLYSSSSDAVKKPLEGLVGKALQASDVADLTWENVVAKCSE